jgi:hypothetical protein
MCGTEMLTQFRQVGVACAIHVLLEQTIKAWMSGTRPGMTGGE